MPLRRRADPPQDRGPLKAMDGDARAIYRSPYLDLIGIEVEEWREDYVRTVLPIRPHHLNRSGVPHGGVVATMLDHAASLSGLYCPVPGRSRYGVTLSLTCSFIGQAREGVLTATGVRTGGGRKVYFAHTEIRDGKGNLIGSAQSVHRYRSGSESLEGVPLRAAGGAEA